MASSGGDDIKMLSSQACEASEKFIKLFYDTLDKRRHMLEKLYLDTATLLWNGNNVTGVREIMKFLETLPVSEHMVDAVDAQPIPSVVTHGQTSIIVVVRGSVKYQGNKAQIFTQSFMLTSQQNTWKIVTDDLRTAT